ncbi:MAG: hypothetical protein GY853_13300 [PVC group bacterium]|nr:hypothetical protein [PVC group bacterium]
MALKRDLGETRLKIDNLESRVSSLEGQIGDITNTLAQAVIAKTEKKVSEKPKKTGK